MDFQKVLRSITRGQLETIPQADLSEIKDTLLAYSKGSRPSKRQHQLKKELAGDLLREVYGEEFECLKTYEKSLVWAMRPSENSAIGFVADEQEKGLWWLDGYAHGHIPKVPTMRAIFIVCGLMGAETVAVYMRNDKARRLARYWQMVGMQRIDDDTFSVKVAPC